MPEGWRETTLGEVVHQVRRPIRVVPGESYNLLGVRWYGNGPFLREVGVGGTIKATQLYAVQRGDFIYNRLFAWKGSFGIVADSLHGSFVSGEFPVFATEASLLSVDYLNLLMCRPTVWSVIEKQSTGSTATSRNRWKEERFLEWEVHLPPLAEQRRIVDLIASVDAAIEACSAHPRYSVTAQALLAEIAATRMVALGSVVSKARAGSTPARSKQSHFGGSLPWLKSGEVNSDWIVHTEETLTREGLDSSSAWVMPPGTIVIAMYGQGLTAGSVGFTGVEMTSNQAVLGLVPDIAVVDSRFLFHWLRSRKLSMRDRRSGSSQPNLNKDLVLQEQVPLLPMREQRRLAELLDSLLRVDVCLDTLASRLDWLRGALLSDLLSGDYEIPDSYDELLSA